MNTGAFNKAVDGMEGSSGTSYRGSDCQTKLENIPTSSGIVDERLHIETLSSRRGLSATQVLNIAANRKDGSKLDMLKDGTKAHKASDAVLSVGSFRETSQLKPQGGVVSQNKPKVDGAQMSGGKNRATDHKWGKVSLKVSDVFGASHKQWKIIEPKGERSSSVESNSGSVSSHQLITNSVSTEATEPFEFDSSNFGVPLSSPQFITKPISADAVKAFDFESSSLTLHLGLHRIKTRSGPLSEDISKRKVEELTSNDTYLERGELTAGKAGESSPPRPLHGQSESQFRGSNCFLSRAGSECMLQKDELHFESSMSAGTFRERVRSRSSGNLNEKSVKNLQTSAASTILCHPRKDPMSQSPRVMEGSANLLTFQSNLHSSSSSSGSNQLLDGTKLKSNELRRGYHRTERLTERKAPSCLTPDFGSDCNRMNDAEGPLKELDVIKETESTKIQSVPQFTGVFKKKRLPNKSFSHELGPSGSCSHGLPSSHSDKDLEELLGILQTRFNTAKEEVDIELSGFAADLVDILDQNNDSFPGWQEQVEDLLVVARHCTIMSACDFRQECENIVHELDEKRQGLPMGLIKQLHIRMLFILTRCTRLLQFQKDTNAQEEGEIHKIRQCLRWVPSFERTRASTISKKGKRALNIKKVCPDILEHAYRDKLPPSVSYELKMAEESSCYSEMRQHIPSDVRKDQLSEANSSDYLKSAVVSIDEKVNNMLPGNEFVSKDVKWGPEYDSRTKKLHVSLDKKASARDVNGEESQESAAVAITPPKQAQRRPQDYWPDQETMEEPDQFICRICEEDVPTSNLEAHSVICAFADNCDGQGLSLNERLKNVADFLERLSELSTMKNSHPLSGDSPDVLKSLKNLSDSSDSFSPVMSEWHGRAAEARFDDLYASDPSSSEDPKAWSNSVNFKSGLGPKSASSAGSLTPRSTLNTPRTSQLDLFWADQSTLVEYDDVKEICELADIAQCIASNSSADEGALEHLAACMHDLNDVLDRNKNGAFTVGTFGRLIYNLLREKYLVHETIDRQKMDMAVASSEDDGTLTDDGFYSLKSTPIHSSYKDRTTIDDFEILKHISRGAFGRVFLAKKRATGDFFAIKVLRKIDMIRKNAVENILAERDILITVCNPFVVRFFYSFTSRENLYLVMEYLNGGDLYSLLRNMGCLEEHVACVYIAELVLALEYLHSLGVVHRDLKPDNILIAHDGHIKLTDFGLSKVGLINSTDDLTGPVPNGTILTDTKIHETSVDNEQAMERHRKRSAVGTPDYLAPEILLGTEHGHPADWWSTGVILFECLTGMPPFNAEHPQIIFDNILNRKIPWPSSDNMSTEARDLIDMLLIEDPTQRLGSRGAMEVKSHPFFQDINWDTLARQKAAFVPSPESVDDTSYFTPRHLDANLYQGRGDSSDCSCSSINTSSVKEGIDEEEDQCADLADFESSPSVKNTFSNFSFKKLSELASINYDLLSQNGKEPLKDHSRQPSAS